MAFASHMTECWKYLLSLGNLFLVNLWKMALFVQPFCKKIYSQRRQLTTYIIILLQEQQQLHIMAPVYLFFSIQFRQHSLIPERLNSKVKSQSIAISCLPETYTNVISAFLKSKPNPPILQTPMSMFDLDYLVRNLRLEYEWLQFVRLTNEVLDVETV